MRCGRVRRVLRKACVRKLRYICYDRSTLKPLWMTRSRHLSYIEYRVLARKFDLVNSNHWTKVFVTTKSIHAQGSAHSGYDGNANCAARIHSDSNHIRQLQWATRNTERISTKAECTR